MLPSDIREFKNYPNVYRFIKDHLSMQFGDVRAMLRLPLPDLKIEHGCNFAIASTLCNLVSGISVSLFLPLLPTKIGRKGKKEWIGSGEAFKQLLGISYPWEHGASQKDKKEKTEVLYVFVRNPFAHALGVHNEASYQIHVARKISRKGTGGSEGLSNEQLQELENSLVRPNWVDPGLSGSGQSWILSAEGFYRDVFHMLWNLAKNPKQMKDADQRFLNGKIIWRTGKP